MPNFEPTVAICTTCKNAETTIGHCIESVMSLDYPKEKLVWIIVDSESSDKTRELASKCLSKNNVKYIIINKKSTIPEGRNICIEKALELSFDYIFFIDADIFILDRFILKGVINLSEGTEGSVFFINTEFKMFSNKEEIVKFIKNVKLEQREMDNRKDKYILNSETWSGTGIFFCKSSILKNVKFDNKLSFFEDRYFGYELHEKGYKVKTIKSKDPIAFDLNVAKHSDIYIKMPVREYLMALNKKSFSLAYSYYNGDFVSSLIRFIKSQDWKRAAFHTSYGMAIIFGLLIGLTINEKIGVLIVTFGIASLVLWTTSMRRRRCNSLKESFSCLLKYSIFGIHIFFSVPIFLIIYKNKFRNFFNNKYSQI